MLINTRREAVQSHGLQCHDGDQLRLLTDLSNELVPELNISVLDRACRYVFKISVNRHDKPWLSSKGLFSILFSFFVIGNGLDLLLISSLPVSTESVYYLPVIMNLSNL